MTDRAGWVPEATANRANLRIWVETPKKHREICGIQLRNSLREVGRWIAKLDDGSKPSQDRLSIVRQMSRSQLAFLLRLETLPARS